MKKKVLAPLILTAFIITGCGSVPATGGSETLPDLSNQILTDNYGYAVVPPTADGYFSNPDLLNEDLPPTGGSPELVSSDSSLSLSDEALVIQGLLDDESKSILQFFLPSGRDKSLSDEALELEDA
jgi:hypothetical protein